MGLILDPRDADFWPHQFVKNGKGYELPPDEWGTPRWAQTYICVHCLEEYIQNFEDPEWIHQSCPARSTGRETKRLLGL